MERREAEEADDDYDGSSEGEASVDVNYFDLDVPDLQAAATAEIRKVRLVDSTGSPFRRDLDDRTEEETQEVERGFGRFVDLLGRLRSVQFLEFSAVNFGSADWFLDEDIERLFREVLPALLTSAPLTTLRFDRCFLPTDYIIVFLNLLSALARQVSLSDLLVESCYFDSIACGPGLAEVIRSNVPIQNLVLTSSIMRMDKDACQRIFHSLSHNVHLRRLEIEIDQLFDDTPMLPSSPASPLRTLCINVQLRTDEAKASLARQLKSNTTLEELHVTYGVSHSPNHRHWIEMLETHNFTLRTITEQYGSGFVIDAAPIRNERVAACLRRNGRIHQALAQLANYRVAPSALLPRALELVSILPTLLYRFMRRGDVSALADLLRLAQQQQQQQQKPSGGGGKKRKKLRTRAAQ